MGMRDREIWVEVDPQRMYNFDLTFPEVIQALAVKNLNVPGGKLRSGRSEFLLRTVGEIDAAEDLRHVILRQTPGGHRIAVDDVARVNETFDIDMGTISRMDGRPSITLSVAKKTEGNSLKVVEAVKNLVMETSDRLHGEVNFGGSTGERLPEEESDSEGVPSVALTPSEVLDSGDSGHDHFLKFTATYDSSIHIRENLGALENNALVGLGLVLVLLYFFLGLRYALMAALGMTISFLGTFVFMSYAGISFNGNSLFGLVLVMGIVVDDAIIILENCYRYMQSGLSPRVAAVKGTNEVMPPVTSAILTTISAFLPLMLLPGVIGEFMKVIPMVVSMALFASLVEAFLILPTHFAEWSGARPSLKRNPLLEKLNHIYPRLLRSSLRFRYVFVGVGLLTCLASAFLIPSLGIDLFQGDELPRFMAFVEMPTGTSLEVTDQVIQRIEAEALTLPKEDVAAVVAVSGLIQEEDWIVNSYVGQVVVDLKQKKIRKRTSDELMDMLRQKVAHISGPKNVRFETMIAGPPMGKAVEIKVKGKEFEKLKEIVNLLKAELRRMPGVYDVGDNFSPGKQEIKVRLDEDKAALFGLSVAEVAETIQAAYQGREASIWRDKDEEVKIFVKLAERWRRDPEDLLRLKIGTPTGFQVPLAKIASLEIEQGFADIRRFKSERAITVHAEIDKKQTSAIEVNTEIEKRAADLLVRFPGYQIDFEGEFKEFQETFDNILQLFMVSVFLIYLILSGQFRSFVQPLIILFTIPFAFLGAMVGILVLGAKFTMITMYGIVALAGIAVNDAIVLITFINNARARGATRYASVVEAGMLRLRPIILTSVTTIGGLLPMAVGLGGHSESWAPLANTIIWGMLFATALTLLIIPAVYTIIVDDIATPMRRRIRSALNLPEATQSELL
jgi:multidrug efflux pump subunit AcrB